MKLLQIRKATRPVGLFTLIEKIKRKKKKKKETIDVVFWNKFFAFLELYCLDWVRAHTKECSMSFFGSHS